MTGRRTSMATTEHASVCTFDCPDACSLTVSVTDGRITKVRGSEAAPFTAEVGVTLIESKAFAMRQLR